MRAAEIVRDALVFVRPGGALLVDLHTANRVGELPSRFVLHGAAGVLACVCAVCGMRSVVMGIAIPRGVVLTAVLTVSMGIHDVSPVVDQYEASLNSVPEY